MRDRAHVRVRSVLMCFVFTPVLEVRCWLFFGNYPTEESLKSAVPCLTVRESVCFEIRLLGLLDHFMDSLLPGNNKS
jgi:hypothetical protein